MTTLGLQMGDRIATLAWSTQNHLEMYYGAMGAGFVCHMLNPRLTVAHLAAMVKERQDRVLAAGAGLAYLALELVVRCPSIKTVIYLDGAKIEARVCLVAALGRPNPRWGERPILIVEPRKSHLIDEKAAFGRAPRQRRRLVDTGSGDSGGPYATGGQRQN